VTIDIFGGNAGDSFAGFDFHTCSIEHGHKRALLLQYRDLLQECRVLLWKCMGSFTIAQGSFAGSDFHTCSTEHKLGATKLLCCNIEIFSGNVGYCCGNLGALLLLVQGLMAGFEVRTCSSERKLVDVGTCSSERK